MEVSAILISTFIVLIGLQLCIPETPNGKFESDVIEKFWTKSPMLRIVYGFFNIIGVLFVLGFLIYLTFSEHWWYIGVYIGGLILAKIVAFILRLLLMPLYKRVNCIYAEVVVQRIAGLSLIILGMSFMMMKITLLILAVILTVVVVIKVIARRKFCKQHERYEDHAIQISRKIYEPLSTSERYAFIYIFYVFKENIRSNVKDLAIALHQIEFEAKALGVKVKDADSFFAALGPDRQIPYCMNILTNIRDKNKTISDFLVYRCSILVNKACGSDRQTGLECKDISEKLFTRMFTSIGYTVEELSSITSNPQDLISLFGREKMV